MKESNYGKTTNIVINTGACTNTSVMRELFITSVEAFNSMYYFLGQAKLINSLLSGIFENYVLAKGHFSYFIT